MDYRSPASRPPATPHVGGCPPACALWPLPACACLPGPVAVGKTPFNPLVQEVASSPMASASAKSSRRCAPHTSPCISSLSPAFPACRGLLGNFREDILCLPYPPNPDPTGIRALSPPLAGSTIRATIWPERAKMLYPAPARSSLEADIFGVARF